MIQTFSECIFQNFEAFVMKIVTRKIDHFENSYEYRNLEGGL
jgi:hypothetical protein